MARRGIFQGLRRRRSALCLIFAYALLLNALAAAVFSVQAVAAALDPLAAAATCAGADTGKDPVRHSGQHQLDCTLCGPACPMGGMAPTLGAAIATAAPRYLSFSLDVSANPASSIDPRSVYVSDRDAQAPPAIG